MESFKNTFVVLVLPVLLIVQLLISQAKAQCASDPILQTSVGGAVINGSLTNSVLLTCRVEGTDQLMYKWVLNGFLVQNTDHFWVLVNPLPEGDIQCGYESCDTLSNTVTVITPPMIMTVPENMTVIEGTNVTLKCEAAGYPHPDISWYFGDTIVGVGTTMMINSVTTDQSGKYVCLAQNSAGYTTSTALVFIITASGQSRPTASLTVDHTVSADLESSITSDMPTSYETAFTTSVTQPSLSVIRSDSTISTAPTTPSSNPKEVPSVVLIVSLSAVALFSVFILLLSLVILHWSHKMCRHSIRKSNAGKENGRFEKISRNTLHTYINASFREDEEESDDMKVELIVPDYDEDRKGVYSAYEYRAQMVKLNDQKCRKKEGTQLSEEPVAVKNEEENDEREGLEDTLIADEQHKTAEEPSVLLKRTDEIEKLIADEQYPTVEEPSVLLKEIDEIEQLNEDWETGNCMEQLGKMAVQEMHNPKWLREMRTSHRSHILQADEVIDLIHKIDLMSVKRLNIHPFQEEFESLPFNTPSLKEWSEETMSKNRYHNILPNLETAVTLSNTGEPGSTYINANYIKGYDGYWKTYISTQAPIYDTVPDFWRMIWEQNIDSIVMLTGIFEGGKNMCAKYWPSSQGADTQRYGNFVVRNNHEESYPSYKITFLSVCPVNQIDSPKAEKDVYHFSFLGWPDFGVPNEAYGILQLRDVVESLRNPKSPLLVHCSAGLGRSGTYIGLDIGIHQYEKEGVVDPLLILELMRNDRGGMVQTLDQYEFIHRALSNYMVQHPKQIF